MFDFFKKKKRIKEEVFIEEEISIEEKEDSDQRKKEKLEEYRNMRKEKEELWKEQEKEKNRIKEEESKKQEEENFYYILNGGTLETKIGFVRLWDTEKEEIIKCNLSLQNHEIYIELYEENPNVISSIQKIDAGQGFYRIETSQSEYSTIIQILCDHDLVGTFMADKYYNTIKFEEHFKILNKVYIKNQEDFHNRVKSYYKELIINNEVKQLVHNYIAKTSNDFLLDLNYIIPFERLLKFKYKQGQTSLIISHPQLNHLLYFNGIAENFDIDYKKITYYFDTYFIKLVNIIKKYIDDNSNEVAMFITWKLLNNVAENYFYQLFVTDFGIYLNLDEQDTLDEIIKKYLMIDMVNIYSAQNAGYFTYFLMYLNKFEDSSNYLLCNNILIEKLNELIKLKEVDDFESLLMSNNDVNKISIDDIDLMNGTEFEYFTSELFNKMGYKSMVTKASGDQGIDIIIEKNGIKIGVQAKCYSSSVSNKAIQEVVAGLNHYKLEKGIVVTNNYFTNSAIELAHSNNVILWDRNVLKEKINSYF